MGYPVDNPFRQPVEFVASATSIAAAVAILCGTPWIGFGQVTGAAFAVGLASHAVWRCRQGVQIAKFHTNLRWLPTYELHSAEIPCSDTEQFLGMGFWWTQTHTQRLFLARSPRYKHLRARNDLYEWARARARAHPSGHLTRLLNWRSPWNPVAPLPPVGGDPAIHGVELKERPIWTPLAERVGHTLVLGTTRVGKTRLAELLITQDIRRGDVVVVFDPKGDVNLLKRMYAEASRSGRKDNFYFFHLGNPELSDKHSPLSSFGRITEIATRVANPLPGEGNSAAFKQFVWLYVNIISRTGAALGMNLTHELIYRFAADLDGLAEKYFEQWLDRSHPEWRDDKELNDNTIGEKLLQSRIQQTGRTQTIIEMLDLIQKKGWHDPIADGLVSVLSNNKSRYQALINSLFPLLEKLTTGKISELLSPTWDNPSDKRRPFDWDMIMDTGGMVYIGLDSLSDHEVASAVGGAMFAGLTSAAGRRYKHGAAYGQSRGLDLAQARKVCIHADEFNELIGDEFIPMVNKAGGAGYQVTAYTQTWSDVEAKIGSAAKAAQIGGNFNTMYMLRVKNTETAELLTKQLPMVEVYSSMMVSGANDTQNPEEFADFSAGAQDRLTARPVEMIQPADLTQLPKGQAFALLEGGQLAKIRLPLAIGDDSDIHWPTDLTRVFTGMHAQYERYVSGLPIDFGGSSSDSLVVEGAGGGY